MASQCVCVLHFPLNSDIQKTLNIQITYSKNIIFLNESCPKEVNCRLKSCMCRAVEAQLTCNNLFLWLSQWKSLFVSDEPRRWQTYVHGKYISKSLISLPFKSRKKTQNQTALFLLNSIVNRSNIVWGFSIKAKRMDVIKYKTANFENMEVTG